MGLCYDRVDRAVRPAGAPRDEGLEGLLDAPSRRFQPGDELVGRIYSDVYGELSSEAELFSPAPSALQVEPPHSLLSRPRRVEPVIVQHEQLVAFFVDVLGWVPSYVVPVPQPRDEERASPSGHRPGIAEEPQVVLLRPVSDAREHVQDRVEARRCEHRAEFAHVADEELGPPGRQLEAFGLPLRHGDEMWREVDAGDFEAQPGERYRQPPYPTRDVQDPAGPETFMGEIGRDRHCVFLASLPHAFEDELIELRVPHEDVLRPVHASLSLRPIEKPGPQAGPGLVLPRSAPRLGDCDTDRSRDGSSQGKGAYGQEADAWRARGGLGGGHGSEVRC